MPLPRPRRPKPVIAILSLAVTAVTAVALVGCIAPPPVDTVGKVAFETALPIPPLLEGPEFDLEAQAGTTEFEPGVPTGTLGYNGSYLGPTLVMHRGEQVGVHLTNNLEDATTLHWHGMHLPAEMDGGPHQPVAPGQQSDPSWTVDQPAATLWYHPHPHGETERQVGMGLAGMVIVRDEVEAALPLPRDYGVDDLPVIVQDAILGDGPLSRGDAGLIGGLGTQLLVNGAVGPYADVTTDVVRLRLLNASPARIYQFTFSDRRTFAMIASDGGLLEAPAPLESIRLSPGERAEILVTMTAGESVVLQSVDPELGDTIGFLGATGDSDKFDVLELRAADTLVQRGTVPAALVPIERLDPETAAAERTFTLDGTQINNQDMDLSRVDATVEVDTTEVWNVRSEMSFPHNFHIHDVQFQVISINGQAPPPELSGWKDTVYVQPHGEYRLVMRFEDYTDPDSPYMYHCHLLRHEDSGMMGQFVVVQPGQSAGMIGEGTHHEH
jgi:suppressor of ftsI